MKNYIVTIARQYGSGGREVGQRLAEILGCDFFDKNLITMASQRSGLDSETLGNVDEHAANSLLYTLALGSSSYSHGLERVNLPINDKLFVIQSEIIKEISKNGKGAVIVGRCADYVISDDPNLVKIFICADFTNRVKTVMERHNLKEAQAKDITVKTDRRRSNYYSYYTGEKWGKADKYDLIVSTDKIGIEGAAQLIASYLIMLDRMDQIK